MSVILIMRPANMAFGDKSGGNKIANFRYCVYGELAVLLQSISELIPITNYYRHEVF